MNEKNLDPSTGQFIDPMFAVMIAAAVGETIMVWVKQGAIPDFFTLMIVIVGYVNLLLSWFGYHKSVLKKPILGSLRFIVTVVLLPLYLLTVVLATKPFYCVALTYAAIFFLWSFWERLKYREYSLEQSFLWFQLRPYNVMVYVAAIYVVMAEFIPASSASILPDWVFSLADPLGLLVIVCAIVVLRAQKSSKNSNTPISKIFGQIKILLFGGPADV
ncbi:MULTISPECIES: hypothetical protein [Pseudomonas]|uniref:Uncharacterized protein n=1 Tax=Pseudomonas syringae pv. actinidiae TaxID=103796 RepID=A0A7Z6XWR8_PSESF|nr:MULTISPECIES: hypothetical protein [Pseudomonas]MBJ2287704.1 hypothetical protein [Pseudomonas sp. MF6755]RMP78246.1 hypothetical protein ALQ15_02851 [Pseudomonas syringae pv. actinidiae]